MIKIHRKDNLDAACQQLANRIRALWDGERPVEILFREWKDPHTRSQQALYRIWCRHLGKTFGVQEDDMHDMLRNRFIGGEEIMVLGQKVVRLISTTALTKEAMSDYMRQVEVWAVRDMGVSLPMPEDNEYVKYREAAA